MHRLRLLFIALAVLLVIVLVLQNTESVETRMLFMKVSVPRAVLLASTYLIGLVSGILIAVRLSASKEREQ